MTHDSKIVGFKKLNFGKSLTEFHHENQLKKE
jgi:hypothetical protein